MKVIYLLKDMLFNKNICILGVDGTGKSTVIKALAERLNISIEVQYMGSRDYITSNMKRLEFGDKSQSNNSVKNIIYILNEMWVRVVRHWGKGKVVIYDRYFWDRYLALTGMKRKVGKILFRYLFPKPKHIIYLYCDLKTSLNRKDDILDIESFRLIKDNFDKEFLECKNVLKISTDLYNTNEVIEIIINQVKGR